MKKKSLFLTLCLSLFILAGCSFPGSTDSPNSNVTSNNNDKPETITVFSINDLHGALNEYPEYKELGILKLDYAIKSDPDYNPETSVIISAGDSWQGGYLAHEEKDITDKLLGKMGVDAMALGNHEFDWGIENIKTLRSKSPFPYLGCNIQNPNGKKATDLCDSSTIVEKGGAKVGIIGAMGPNEESSIASDMLANYSFSYSMKFITDEVTKLKEENCDLIIMAVHDSVNSNSGYVTNIGNTFNVSQIQGIFGGHTHIFENETAGSNNLPFVQAGANGQGYAKMKFSLKTKGCLSKKYVKSYANFGDTDVSLLNAEMKSVLDSANSKYKGNDILCTFDGEFRKGREMNGFVTTAMLEQAKHYGWKGSNEMIAIHNLSGIRSSIPSGEVTKEKLFKTSPFDNEVRVIKNLSGSNLSKIIGQIEDAHESKYYAYTRENNKMFDSSIKYDVVTIDFVSEGKYFNQYFSTAPQYNFVKSTNSIEYIFDTLSGYIENSENKTFNASDYL